MIKDDLAPPLPTVSIYLFAILGRSIRRTGATPVVVRASVSTANRWLVWPIGCLLVLLVFSLTNSWGRSGPGRASTAENTKGKSTGAKDRGP